MSKIALRPIITDHSERMLMDLAEDIAHGRCSRDQIRDWLVVYEMETGDHSLRDIFSLPEEDPDLITYLS
jgi:hypothetical protein